MESVNNKFYGLYEPTGAGDEPLSVDVDKENLEFQMEYEYSGDDLKLIEIDFNEWLQCLYYLGYEVVDELSDLLERYPLDHTDKYKYGLIAYGNNWRGATGVKLCNSIKEVFERSYEASYSDIRRIKSGKYIVYRESSHDCPTGALCVAVRLNKSEHRRASQHIRGDYDYLVSLGDKAKAKLGL